MTTETVLLESRIIEIAQSLGWQTQYGEVEENAVELARAIEQAVLQSPEIHRALQDKARLDWIEAQGGADITRLSGGDWECDAGSGYGFVEMDRGMRAAIDAAMEQNQ